MRRKIPSTAALISFEAAARHQSFTKAADETGPDPERDLPADRRAGGVSRHRAVPPLTPWGQAHRGRAVL